MSSAIENVVGRDLNDTLSVFRQQGRAEAVDTIGSLEVVLGLVSSCVGCAVDDEVEALGFEKCLHCGFIGDVQLVSTNKDSGIPQQEAQFTAQLSIRPSD